MKHGVRLRGLAHLSAHEALKYLIADVLTRSLVAMVNVLHRLNGSHIRRLIHLIISTIEVM